MRGPSRQRGTRSGLGPASLMLATLAASGCSGSTSLPGDLQLLQTSSAGLTPPAAALLEEAKVGARTRSQGTLVGVGVGALAGCLLGGRRCNLGNAAIGGAAGGFLGYAAGAYVAERSRQAARRETALNGLIAAAEADTARYARARDLAIATSEATRAEIARLNVEYAAGRATASAYRDQARQLNTALASTDALIKEAEGVGEQIAGDANDLRFLGQDPTPLEARRATLLEERESLRAAYQALLRGAAGMPPEARRLVAAAPP